MSTLEDHVGPNFLKNVDKALAEIKHEKSNKQVATEYDWFCRTLLPLFMGKEIDPEFNEKYIDFVGGTDVRLNVVQGDKLRLSIPPVLDTVRVKSSAEQKKPNVHEAFVEYSKMSIINSSAAITQLNDTISQNYDALDIDNYYTNMLQWNEVLEENGYEKYDLSGIALIAKDKRGEGEINSSKELDEDKPTFSDDFGDW